MKTKLPVTIQSSYERLDVGACREAIIGCEVAQSFEALGASRDEWDRFVQEIGGDVYLTYDWCRVWWELYGRNRELSICVYRDAQCRLCGVVPMFVERVRLGPLSLKVARIVGSDHTIAVCDPAIRSEFAGPVLRDLAARMLTGVSCDALLLSPTYADTPLANATQRAFEGMPNIATRVKLLAPLTCIPLPESFEAYLGMIPKRQAGNYRRDLKLLMRNFALKSDAISENPEVAEEFERFAVMHREQWAHDGKLGHFGDWPLSLEFNRRLVNALTPLDRVRMVRLRDGDRVLGCQYTFRFGDRYHWRLPARLVGADWERFGLGRMGLLKMIEVAIGEGIKTIEAGPGHYDYKMQLGGIHRSLIALLITGSNWQSRFRARAFEKLGDFLHFAYYRIWFQRICPKLRPLQRPLWETWICSHL